MHVIPDVEVTMLDGIVILQAAQLSSRRAQAARRTRPAQRTAGSKRRR
jgi:hypothetical protein